MTGTKTNTMNPNPYLIANIKVEKTSLSNEKKAELIIREIADYHQITTKAMISKIRFQKIVHCRALAAYFIKKHTTMSLGEIGAVLGGRHHSTVIFALQSLNDHMQTEESTRQDVHAIDKILQFKL